MSSSYQRFGGVCGVIAGVAGLIYLVAFLALRDPGAPLPALALLVVSILSSATIVALYHRVRQVDDGFALWGLLLAVLGAGGSAIHAAFDLSNDVRPPAAPFGYANAVDPRGFLTFAVTGLAVIVLAWLIVRGGVLPRALGYLGIATGILLVLLYVAYLTIFNALNPVVLVLILASGLFEPAWNLYLGWTLWRGEARMPATMAAKGAK
jgi:hypothetical protein